MRNRKWGREENVHGQGGAGTKGCVVKSVQRQKCAWSKVYMRDESVCGQKNNNLTGTKVSGTGIYVQVYVRVKYWCEEGRRERGQETGRRRR